MNSQITISTGATTAPFLVLPDNWIVIQPGSGATAKVEYTTGTSVDISAGVATWVTFCSFIANAAVRVGEELQPLYVRITSTGGTTSYSLEGELSTSDRQIIGGYVKKTINLMEIDAIVSLNADRTIRASDDGRQFTCTTALTITIPASLSPRPSFVAHPPASGNLSIAVSGGAQINGSTATLTRSRANNFAGVAVVAYAESDGYGVSGS